MASFAWLAEQRDLIFPGNLAVGGVFRDSSLTFMAKKVVSVLQLVSLTNIPVCVELFDLILQFMLDLACLIDFDDSADTVFNEHGVPVFKPLEGVYLESLSFVSVAVLGIVAPDRFTLRVDLDQFPPSGLAKHIAVLELLNTVNRARSELQEDIALRVVLDDLALVACEYAMHR